MDVITDTSDLDTIDTTRWSTHLNNLCQRVEAFFKNVKPGCTFIYAPKTQGNNEGYQIIVNSNEQNNKSSQKYFVKLQTFHIEDIFGYYLLRKLGVGPQEIYFFLIKENTRYKNTIDIGIVTSDVATSSSQMYNYSQMTRSGKLRSIVCDTTKHDNIHKVKKIKMNKYNPCVRSYMHLLMIPCLMVLSDIPSNTDNWGWINNFELKIYDFSIATMAFSHTFDLTKHNMHAFWKRHIDPSSSEGSFNMLLSHFAKDKTHLFHPAHHKKLKKLIDNACDETIKWVNTSPDTQSWRQDFAYLHKSMAMLDTFTCYYKLVSCSQDKINSILWEQIGCGN